MPRDCLQLRALRLLLLPDLLGTLRPLLLRLLGSLPLPLLLLSLLGPLLLRLLLLRLLDPLLLRLLLPRLLGSLLLRLLSRLSMALLGLVLMSACLRLLRLSLRALLWRGLFLPTLLPFRFALSFVPLVVLRERGDHCPEKQNKGSGTGSSNNLHSILLSKRQHRACTQTTKSASNMFQCFCCIRFGLGLAHRAFRVVGRRVQRRQL